MDHIDALSRIPAGRRDQLQVRSNAKGLAQLAFHVGAIAVFAVWIAAKLPFWHLAMLPLGILWAFLFTLSHECTHATPFRSRWLNDVIGHLCSVPMLLPFTWFRYFHLAHHKHTNDPDRDPELRGRPRPGNLRDFAAYLSGWFYWSTMVQTMWRNAFGVINAPYLPTRRHRAMRREARILLAIYTTVALSLNWTPLAFYLWILPALIGQPLLRLYLLAEHGLCPPVANMLENSRTTFTNRLVRAIAWNMPYHAEHHAFPNVPFHHLPDLHNDLRDSLKSTSNGYAEFSAQYVRHIARDAPPP